MAGFFWSVAVAGRASRARAGSKRRVKSQRRRRRLRSPRPLFLLVVLVLAVPLATAAYLLTTEPGQALLLRVGVTANYPPLADKVDGNLVGIEIDLARQVGQDRRLARRGNRAPTDHRGHRESPRDILSWPGDVPSQPRHYPFTDQPDRIGGVVVHTQGNLRQAGVRKRAQCVHRTV